MKDLVSFLRVVRRQNFILRKKNMDIATISLITNSLEEISCEVVDVYETDPSNLPWNFTFTGERILYWLNTRFVPKNRRFVNELIASIGGKDHHLVTLLSISFGLSLNDDFWIVPEEHSERKWEDHNLYDNEFSETVALVAFTGYTNKIKGIASSPEFTTDGALPKCWRREEGGIYLYKGGTDGYANSGMEPYTEFLATQVAETMGIDHVKYSLDKWKGKICSVCELFTGPDVSFVPMWVAYPEMGRVPILSEMLGREFEDPFLAMVAFDMLIANHDRHLGNLGFLRDNNSGKLVGLAPAFDHGMSLLHQAMDTDFDVGLGDYLTSLRRMSVLEISESNFHLVSNFLSLKTKSRIRRLLDFEFEQHSEYPVSEKRLKYLSEFIRNRARRMMDL